jgi:Cytochrome c biogenesis factor
MDKGEALIDKERYRQARTLYEDALKKRPKDQRALSGMGRVLIVSERRGEAERGRRMLEEALRLDDTDALAWRDLGIYFQFAEPPKLKEAIRAYENFLRYAPSHRDAKETRSIVKDLKSKL